MYNFPLSEKMSDLLETLDNIDLNAVMQSHGFQPAAKQEKEDAVMYFCPFHKSDRQPHFLISKGSSRGGLYNAPAWRCLRDERRSGYGAIALEAALSGMSVEGNDLRQVMQSLCKIAGIEADCLKDENRNGIVSSPDGFPAEASVERMDGFTPYALQLLGCRTERMYEYKKGEGRAALKDEEGQPVYRYSFGPKFSDKYAKDSNFDIERLHTEMCCWQIASYITPGKGKSKGTKVTAHELYPIFAFIYTTKGDKEYGIIYEPEYSEPESGVCGRRTVFYTGGLAEKDVNLTLCGDAVCMEVLKGKTVPDAVKNINTGEPYQTEVEQKDEDGKSVMVDIPKESVRAYHLIYCSSAVDALCSYFHLNAVRDSYRDEQLKESFFHVCWNEKPDTEYSVYTYAMQKKIAKNLYVLLNLNNAGKNASFRIGKRFSDVRLAFLPYNTEKYVICKGGELRTCASVTDFFRTYQMNKDEAMSSDYDLNKFHLQSLTAALPVNPLIYEPKYDKKGTLMSYNYRLDVMRLWLFMASEGYCREVEKDSKDTMGRILRIRGCFVKELEPQSVIVDASEHLKELAKRLARPNTDDYNKMTNAFVNSRSITNISISNLPVIKVEYNRGYGPELDHFFYRNGALRITPDMIDFVSYNDIDFHVDEAQILPFDFEMPCTRGNEPFSIYENPEYRERLKTLNEHKKDTKNYTQFMIEQEEGELNKWAQHNRWKFDFKGRDEKDWWKPLRVIRCFANEEFEKEAELRREGKEFSEEQYNDLQSRMANLIYSLGRPLFRFKGNGLNFMPYLTENNVTSEGRSEGGSGKSVFGNIFMGCAGKVLSLDARNFKPDTDTSLFLATYIHRVHRVVHWEDWPRIPIDPLFNYVTSGFVSRDYHKKAVRVPLSESPGMIVSSNYQQRYDNDSAEGRTVQTGFSHYFHRANSRKNQRASMISAIMPELRDTPEEIPAEIRNQIAYICALAVQFCMNAKERVLPPMDNLNTRSRVAAMGSKFVEWAEDFFAKPYVYNCPIDIKTIQSEYIDLCEASESKKDLFSLNAFRDKIKEYCNDMGIDPLPEVCLSGGTTGKKYLRAKAWVRQTYFDDEKIWGPGMRKDIRVLTQSQSCLFFCRKGQEPKDYEEVRRICRDYAAQEDPEPYLDIDGNPVTLTEEEQEKWDAYLDMKQGRKRSYQKSGEAASAASGNDGNKEVKDDLPF